MSLRFVGINLHRSLKRHRNSFGWDLDCDWTIDSFFIHFLVDLLFCWLWLSCCMTKFQLGFSCFTDDPPFDSRIRRTEEFTVYSVTARCPGSVAAKQTQTPPPPCLTAGIWCLCWYSVFGFHQTCHDVRHRHLDLISPKNIDLEVLWFVHVQICKPKLCYLLLEVFVWSVSNCTVMNFWSCWVFLSFSEHCTIWPLDTFAGTSAQLC